MGIHLDGFEDRAAGVLNYVLDDLISNNRAKR